MKKKSFIIIAAILLMAAGGILLGNNSMNTTKSTSNPPMDGIYIVHVIIDASADTWCLANCVEKVVVSNSKGEVQEQDFVYNTWEYDFYFKAPLENGWLAAGLILIPNCCPNFDYDPGYATGSWYANDYQILIIRINN